MTGFLTWVIDRLFALRKRSRFVLDAQWGNRANENGESVRTLFLHMKHQGTRGVEGVRFAMHLLRDGSARQYRVRQADSKYRLEAGWFGPPTTSRKREVSSMDFDRWRRYTVWLEVDADYFQDQEPAFLMVQMIADDIEPVDALYRISSPFAPIVRVRRWRSRKVWKQANVWREKLRMSGMRDPLGDA